MSNCTNTIPEHAIHASNGKPILFGPDGGAGTTARIVSEYLGYQLDPRAIGDGKCCLVPDGARTQKPLTVPERAIVEAFAWYFREYAPGLRRNEVVTIPKTINEGSLEDAFPDEASAYRFAEVAEHHFDVNAEVVETAAGWGVAVHDPDGLNAATMEQLRGVYRMITGDAVERLKKGGAEDAAPGTGRQGESRRAGRMQRIEDGIDAILARLGGNDGMAEFIATGRER